MSVAKKNMDIINGTLWNKILVFALPLAASNMLQQLFNSADVAVVGQFVGKNALAAVGSNGSVINLLINIFSGLAIGTNVVVSFALGVDDKKQVENAVHTSVLLSFISGIFVMLLGICIAKPILLLMGTPGDVIDLAVLYLRIYFLGMPFIMFYNFGAAILRSRGDTKRPFLCLLLSGVINVILNLFFVIVCKLGVAGVGIATVTSNVVSASMLFRFLLKEEGAIKLSIKKLHIDKKLLMKIAKIGIPAGVQGTVFSLSNMCIQSALNSLGSDYVAGAVAAMNLENLAYFMMNGFSQAAVTFTSQNYGAGKLDRCTRSVRLCILMGAISNMIVSYSFLYLGGNVVRFYTTEPKIIEIAIERMWYSLPLHFSMAFMETYSGGMRGFGRTVTPAVISACGACGVRLIWVYTAFRCSPSLSVLMIIYPISWVLTSVVEGIAFNLIKRKVIAQKS